MSYEGNTASVQMQNSWEGIKTALLKEFGAPTFNKWIAPVFPRLLDNGTLELTAATRFKRDWIRTHYADRIRHIWAQKHGPLARVDIVASLTKEEDSNPISVDAPANMNEMPDVLSSPLDPRFTFENFIVGESNELAAAAARRIADNNGVTFNPLFIHGGVGLGKTHLMHAIAQEIRVKSPQRRAVYMSAEKFMYQFVQAIRAKNTMPFKEQFRSVDVLMIDDIQFICGKTSTQEEFFHTFNVLVGQNKQIVISADRPPSSLDGLDERLRSRLGGGLAADIHPADNALRLSILEKKASLLKRDVPRDVLDFLAQKITSNIRELEGALIRVIAHAELNNRPITVEGVQIQLKDILRANGRRASIEDIQRRVAEYYGIRLPDMQSPRKARAVARPRQIAMYLSKVMTEHSLPDIGRKFGGRDHTTIIHGIRKIETLMAEDPSLKEDIEALKRSIGSGA